MGRDGNPMNIVVFGEHSIDLDLLGTNPVVLDVGCRGFCFGNSLRGERPLAVIHELDIDYLVSSQPYTRAGMAGFTGQTGCSCDEDPPSRHMVPGTEVPCYTLKDYSSLHGIQQWDAIKLDCEGAEYPILVSFDRAWAKQISVEFHQHTHCRRSDQKLKDLMDHLSQWYDVVQHRLESRYDCGPNYWDTLLVARPQFVITP
jgi:hypothetical protein